MDLHLTPFEGHPINFAYTIGFTETFGYPEAVVLGLSADTAAYVLAGLAEKLAAGERPQLNHAVDLGLNFPLVLRTVPAPAARARMYIANAFYAERAYQTVQVVWPDFQGRFPWEAGYISVGSYQPQLFEGPAPD